MKDILEKLSKPLGKNDIELRVGMATQKGFTLLLYKTARVDVRRLNESGAIWKNRHFYDDKGLLCCEISIYNTDIKEWVNRSDVGVESMTEKEKGSYSDSFKRAGFRWGVGLELYEAPFIFITSFQMEQVKGKWKPKGFFAGSVEVTKYEVSFGKILIEISYKGKGVIFSNFPKKEWEMTDKQKAMLEAKISNTKSDREKIKETYRVKHLRDLSKEQFEHLLALLDKKAIS